MNSSLANALGKAAREAKSLSYDDENVIKIIDEEKQIHLNEIDVIKEKNKWAANWKKSFKNNGLVKILTFLELDFVC